ncbi:aldehyde ferredoxin oxidoreductase C-terminal domain-containing protein, partial [Chloroflexota bacterium]
TEEEIRKELRDRGIKTLSIGQAGENMVRMACPIATGDRAPGRTGTGAVMGSKNLKAIAVRGSKSVKVAEPDKYIKLVKKWHDDGPHQSMYNLIAIEQGTAFLLRAENESYGLGIRNAQEIHLPEEILGTLYGDRITPKYGRQRVGCFACPTLCARLMIINDGPYAGEKGKRPEGGCLMSFGPRIGVYDDFPFIFRVTHLANQYGMDSVSLSAVIAAAMEWFQRGIITREDTDGLELEWGNKPVILELLRKIATREGFGGVLAEGTLKAAKKIGKEAEKYVYHSQGMDEYNGYAPDTMGANLAFATSTRGFDHLRGMPTKMMPELRDGAKPGEMLSGTSYDSRWAEIVQWTRRMNTAADLAEVCKFNTEWALFDKDCNVARIAELLAAITGVDFNEELLIQACDRVYCVEKAYNVREGNRREDDNPPSQFFERPIWDGPNKGFQLDKVKFGELKDYYYELEGWDKKSGAPSREALERLSLKYIADELEKHGVYQ